MRTHKPIVATRGKHNSYHKVVHELPEVGKAALLCERVWVVAVCVHHAVGLQGTGALKENGGQLLQAVSGGEVEQRGQLFVTLV